MYQTCFLKSIFSLSSYKSLFRLLWILLISLSSLFCLCDITNFLWYFHRAKFRSTHRAKWATSAGSVSSWNSLAVSGSNDRLNDHSNGIRNVLYSMHCHGIGNPDDLWLNPQRVPQFYRLSHRLLRLFIGQAKVFFGWHSTTLRSTNQSLRLRWLR
jgi:hypothetical protein